jgi:hypothetical protein
LDKSIKYNKNIFTHNKDSQELIKSGHSKRAILRWQRQEKVIKLAPGQCINDSTWKELSPGQKHLAQVIAIHVPCTTLFSRITVQLSRGLVNLNPPRDVQMRGDGSAK